MFVRTKEKVYEVVEENERYYKCCYDDGSITLVAKFDNDVNGFSKALKTSDTIEELCDGLVIAYKDCCEKRTYLYSRTIQDFKESRPNYKNKFFTYYGAIWVDGKGLIYVAKFNKNGELELICQN